MGGSYAGILGPVAFLTMMGRGFLNDQPVESTLVAAWLSLLAFAAIGYIVGKLAGQIIEDSVRAEVVAELAAQEAPQEPQVRTES